MREISFVKKLKFNFQGSVTKKALVIGDADNDQHNELVCANLQGDLAIFKDRHKERFAHASGLGMVSACLIGDIINTDLNYVVAINTEGWLYIFDVANQRFDSKGHMSPLSREESTPTSGLRINFSSQLESLSGHLDSVSHESTPSPTIKLSSIYEQRMPANCKELLLADLDGDGQNELIVGLTDRVLRTYKWIKIGSDGGKFVGLYKWEFADQIGSVSLNSSRHERCQDIIVAQPGGTYAKLECFDKKPSNSMLSSMTEAHDNPEAGSVQSQNMPQSRSMDKINSACDEVRTEFISKLMPEYHQLALAQMRNHHISTEVLGGIRDSKSSNRASLIVIATLDGTLMLVNKDEILWSLQVDHQLFALALLETRKPTKRSTSMSQSGSTCTIVPSDSYVSGRRVLYPNQESRNELSQYFIACAWNGKTYIIDEEHNYLRFKFDEAVSAFTAGNYYFDHDSHACLVYATFNNQIVLYYDVIIDHIRPHYLLDEIVNNPEHSDLCKKLKGLAIKIRSKDDLKETRCDGQTHHEVDQMEMVDLLRDLLHGVSDEEIVIRD